MKKLTALFLVLTLGVSLCACSVLDKVKNVKLPPLPTAIPEATAAPQSTPSPAVTEAPKEENTHALSNHVVVGISKSTQEFYDQQYGTQKILSFSYETPAIYIEGREETASAINEYIARLDETYVTGNDYGVGSAEGISLLLEQAQDNYAVSVENGLDMPLEFASDRTVKTGRLDENCITLIYTDYMYTGGAHGIYAERGYVFDCDTGRRVGIGDLSADAQQLSDHLTGCMMQLISEDREQYYSQRISEGYLMDTTVDAAVRALIRDGNWYFDSEGMCIFSDVYEIAPYAVGIVEFHIPYSMLSGHIDSKWIKAAESEPGELTAGTMDEIRDGSAEIIDRVAADEVGTDIALIADGAIYQVRLSRVEYLDDFYETEQLWGCSYMKDCVLQLVTDLPDGMPNMMISYLDAAGNSHSKLITFSGEDGHIILMDKNSVSALG